MKTVTDTFPLPCTPAEFWRVFLDGSYTQGVYMEALGFQRFSMLELTETSRKTLCTPKLNLPGPLQKLVGDSFAYEEHGTLDRAAGVWTWKMLQPAGADGKRKTGMVTTRGTTRIVAAGENGCRRSDEVIVEAHVFGLGGMIESTVEKEVRAGWTKERSFFERWLQKTRA